MKLKKILSSTMVLVLVISVLSGCGGSENNTTASTQEDKEVVQVTPEIKFPLDNPVTMSMFAITNVEELPDNKGFQKMEQMTNIKWDVQSTLGSDINEKRNLLFASNKYPDVFYKSGFSQNDVDKYGKQGSLIPLEDLIEDYAPNLVALMEKNPEIKNIITSPDGHIYAFPEIDKPMPYGPYLFINKEWIENVGMNEPTNLDELYELYKAFKTQDPNKNGENDEIPLTFFAADLWNPFFLLPYFGVPVDYATNCYVSEDEILFAPTSEAYKEEIKYLTKLYDESLLDPNAFIQTIAQQQAKGQSGEIFGSFNDAGAFLTTGRGEDLSYPMLTPFEKESYPVNINVSPGTFVITDACETPELAVKWADYFYSEEGAILCWMGTEGESYKMNEDGTWNWIVGEGEDISSVRQKNALQGAALHTGLQPDLFFKTTDENEGFLNDEKARLLEYCAQPFPKLKYSTEDQKLVSTVTADILPYIQEYTAKCVTGTFSVDESWEEYLTTLNNMGLEDLMSIYQKAYEIEK